MKKDYEKITADAVSNITKALESDIFFGGPDQEAKSKLKSFLARLNIKSAKLSGSNFGALKMEGIDAQLKSVTFSDEHLKLWKNLNKV